MAFVDTGLRSTANYVLSRTGSPENGGFVDTRSVSGIPTARELPSTALESLIQNRKAYSFPVFSKLRKFPTFLASIFPAENLAGPVFAASYIWHNDTKMTS